MTLMASHPASARDANVCSQLVPPGHLTAPRVSSKLVAMGFSGVGRREDRDPPALNDKPTPTRSWLVLVPTSPLHGCRGILLQHNPLFPHSVHNYVFPEHRLDQAVGAGRGCPWGSRQRRPLSGSARVTLLRAPSSPLGRSPNSFLQHSKHLRTCPLPTCAGWPPIPPHPSPDQTGCPVLGSSSKSIFGAVTPQSGATCPLLGPACPSISPKDRLPPGLRGEVVTPRVALNEAFLPLGRSFLICV